ncbi:MAG: isopeptide-forming domain-containing fimbrial protein [Oscillospiraceae bacterium]|nr:isopeptide-forming domain-containing fimbrial protein [Oscillospiraceae bacterium]
MKKTFALVLTVIMLFTLALPAFAAEPTVSLTIAGEKSGHIYEAYQVFDGKLNASGVMTEITWGSGLKDTDALLAALKADTATFGSDFAAATSAEGVANAMKAWGDKGPKIDAFADLLKSYLVTPAVYTTTSSTTTYTFDALDPGYYLIKDQDGTVDEKNDFYTKFLLDVTTSTDVAVKGSVPTVKKEVSTQLSSGYSDKIANQLNKEHYYQWTGTIPDDIADYDWYYYEFVDTLSDGLTFIDFEEIYIQTNTNKIEIFNAAVEDDPATPEDERIKDPVRYPDVVDADDSDNKIGLVWNDLKGDYNALAPNNTIVVRYSAKLNENAVIGGAGNLNEVELIFSNNPHDEDDKGKTPPMDPRVYSFALEVVKRADSETGEVLKGAKFILYHNHTVETTPGSGSYVNVPVYAKVTDGKILEWVEDEDDATVLTTDASGKINVAGLTVKITYYLKEIEAPDGYNKLTRDVAVIIDSFETSATNYKVSKITYNVDNSQKTSTGATAEAGTVVATVINRAGTTLPSTGGIGTTLFYIAGGLMVAVAVVLLVTKKRMNSQ